MGIRSTPINLYRNSYLPNLLAKHSIPIGASILRSPKVERVEAAKQSQVAVYAAVQRSALYNNEPRKISSYVFRGDANEQKSENNKNSAAKLESHVENQQVTVESSKSREEGGKEKSENNRDAKIATFFFLYVAAEFEYQTKIKPYFSESSSENVGSRKTTICPSAGSNKVEVPVTIVEPKKEATTLSPIDESFFEETLSPDIKNGIVTSEEETLVEEKKAPVETVSQENEVDIRNAFNSSIADVRESQKQQCETAPVSSNENQSNPVEMDSQEEEVESKTVLVPSFSAVRESKESGRQEPAAIFIATLLLSAVALFCIARNKE
jgi:hypothetical protein